MLVAELVAVLVAELVAVLVAELVDACFVAMLAAACFVAAYLVVVGCVASTVGFALGKKRPCH